MAGAGLSVFETKMRAKAIPWTVILQLIQALISMFGGVCPAPTPPANKADLQAVPRKRVRLAVAYRRENPQATFAEAFAASDAAISVLDESTDEEVAAFAADLAA